MCCFCFCLQGYPNGHDSIKMGPWYCATCCRPKSVPRIRQRFWFSIESADCWISNSYIIWDVGAKPDGLYWLSGSSLTFKSHPWLPNLQSTIPPQSPETKSGWWLTYPSEKYEFVNGKDDNPYIMENKTYVWNHQAEIITKSIGPFQGKFKIVSDMKASSITATRSMAPGRKSKRKKSFPQSARAKLVSSGVQLGGCWWRLRLLCCGTLPTKRTKQCLDIWILHESSKSSI